MGKEDKNKENSSSGADLGPCASGDHVSLKEGQNRVATPYKSAIGFHMRPNVELQQILCC